MWSRSRTKKLTRFPSRSDRWRMQSHRPGPLKPQITGRGDQECGYRDTIEDVPVSHISQSALTVLGFVWKHTQGKGLRNL
jgi:hypothetical protein